MIGDGWDDQPEVGEDEGVKYAVHTSYEVDGGSSEVREAASNDGNNISGRAGSGSMVAGLPGTNRGNLLPPVVGADSVTQLRCSKTHLDGDERSSGATLASPRCDASNGVDRLQILFKEVEGGQRNITV